MPSSRPIQRGSWGLEVDQPLFMPPNDPHEAYRLSQYVPFTSQFLPKALFQRDNFTFVSQNPKNLCTITS